MTDKVIRVKKKDAPPARNGELPVATDNDSKVEIARELEPTEMLSGNTYAQFSDADVSVFIQMLTNQNTILRVLSQLLDKELSAQSAAALKREIAECSQATVRTQRPVYDALVARSAKK